MKKYFLFLVCLYPLLAYAQPANDDCLQAIPITSLTSWCSGTGQYSNLVATPSGFSSSLGPCNPNWDNDVWFSFTAQALDLTVTVNPQSMRGVSIGLLTGTCGSNMTMIACQTTFGNGSLDLYKGGGLPGETYYIRISSSNPGTFQFCINNYNQPVAPGSDCVTASYLCDKSPFTIQSITSAGNDPNEAAGTCLDNGGGTSSESNSTWFKWECDQSGSLAFTLFPNNPRDDLDFVVYELTNGINSCAKTKLRCEASGESSPGACIGATGLSFSATDTDESPGCMLGQDNFVRYIDMQAGRAYALMVNNYSASGNGFSITFSGNGTFKGPKADFTVAPTDHLCVGTPITITSTSSAGAGATIVQESWVFGSSAQPITTATGTGPYTINYGTYGNHLIVHTVKSSLGCVVTKISQNIFIDTLALVPTIIPPTCGGGQDGGATISVSRGTAPYVYLWSNGSTANGIFNVPEGNYAVTVTDNSGCIANDSVYVRELELIAAANSFENPRCTNTATGQLNMIITNGQSPYSFNFNNSGTFVQNPVFPNLTAGNYTVVARDGNNCETSFNFSLIDPPLLIVTIKDSTNLRCYGDTDARAKAVPAGGTPAYSFVWSDTRQQTTEQATALVAGNYTVTITDSKGCTLTRNFHIEQPGPIEILRTFVRNSPCFGQNKGSISIPEVSGGVLPYSFSSNCSTFQADSVLQNLFSGSYNVCVQDANGCSTSTGAIISQPLPESVDAGSDVVINLGESIELTATADPSNILGTYAWVPIENLSCNPCRKVVAQPYNTTIYTVKFTDYKGCEYTDNVTVEVNKKRPVYIPNIFTPNNDGLNDVFRPFCDASIRAVRKLQVFDRWGELIYNGANLLPNMDKNAWDGTFKGRLVNPSVFAYLVEIEFIDGVVQQYQGDVTVVY